MTIDVCERKNKTQKTKETQYVDADDHPFHPKTFRNRGVMENSLFLKDEKDS